MNDYMVFAHCDDCIYCKRDEYGEVWCDRDTEPVYNEEQECVECASKKMWRIVG